MPVAISIKLQKIQLQELTLCTHYSQYDKNPTGFVTAGFFTTTGKWYAVGMVTIKTAEVMGLSAIASPAFLRNPKLITDLKS